MQAQTCPWARSRTPRRSPFPCQHVILRAIHCSWSRAFSIWCLVQTPDASFAYHNCFICLASNVDAGAHAMWFKILRRFMAWPPVELCSLYIPSMITMDPASHVRIFPAWSRLPEDHKKIMSPPSRRNWSSSPINGFLYSSFFFKYYTANHSRCFTYAVKIIIEWHQTFKVGQPWSTQPASTISKITEHHKRRGHFCDTLIFKRLGALHKYIDNLIYGMWTQ